MRSIIFALTLAASAFLPAVAGAECLPSPVAVRAAHGHSAWSTYRTINGHRCWMEGERPSERHTKVAARSPVPRQRPHTAPPIRTVPIDETAPRWPETTEVAPPAPLPCALLGHGNNDLCAAVRAYVVANADALDRHRREAIGVSVGVIEDYLAREAVR